MTRDLHHADGSLREREAGRKARFRYGAAVDSVSEPETIGYLLRRPHRVILSFEFLLAGCLCIAGYKANPTFSFLFPADGTLMVFALTTLVGAWIIAQRGIRIEGTLALGLYALFCVWILTTILWTKEPTLNALSDYIVRVVLLNGIILIGILGIVAGSPGRTMRFLVATAILALPLALDYIVNAGIAHRGSLEDRNYLIIGRVVSVGFIILFGFMVYARTFSPQWTLCLAGAGILFYATLIIGSRQSFIAMLLQVSLILAMAIHIGRGTITIRRGAVPAVFVVLAALAALLMMLQGGGESWTLQRMSSLFRFVSGDSEVEGSAEQRLKYLLAALRYWSDSWWSVFFGDGLFSFSQQYRGMYHPGASPHNLVAAILTEFGLVGLVIFLVLVTSLVLPGALRIDRRSGLAAVLVALAIGAGFRVMTSGDMANTAVLLAYLGLLSSLRKQVVHSARPTRGQAGVSLPDGLRRPG